MIIVFPMLCSSNVSPNILPGICKVVEKYLLIYNMDYILKMSRAFSFAKSGAVKLTGLNRLKIENNVFTEMPAPSSGTKTKSGSGSKTKTNNTKEKEYKPSKSNERTSIVLPKSDNSIAVEPTWVQIETPLSGLQLLGIKVIPFQVNSDESFVDLIMNDSKLKKMNLLINKLSRSAIQTFWRICRGLRVPFIKSRALTGDPKKDIIFAKSGHGSKTVALLNQADFENSNIFGSPKAVKKLHSLKWPSFIIADDVDKMATFCMKDFNGLCSKVAYSFIYASISKEHNMVYNDLEDVRKTASPFFNRKIKNNKVFESCCNKNENYLEESEYIIENASAFIKSMTTSKAKAILTSIETSLKEKNVKNLSKILKIGKSVTLGPIEKICSKSMPGFDNSYELSQKVIKNSLTIKNSLIKPVSCFISIISNFKKDDPKKETKVNLKKFVEKMRKVQPIKEDWVDDVSDRMQGNVLDYGDKLIDILISLIVGAAVGVAGIVSFFAAQPLILAIVVILLVIILLALLTKDS